MAEFDSLESIAQTDALLDAIGAGRRFTPGAIIAGILGTLAIALSLGASLSAYTATILNNNNTAASGTLAITETRGAATCNSYDATATCSTINKYGGTATPLVPGGSQTVTVNFANTGTVAVGSSNLTPAACVASTVPGPGATTPTTPNTSAGNLCSVVNIAVYKASTATGTALYNGPASGFTAVVNTGTLAAGANQDYTFVVSLPAGATTAVQGQSISQNLTWNFSQ